MLSEKQKESINRSIGYLDCMIDVEYRGLLSRDALNELYDIFKLKFREILEND